MEALSNYHPIKIGAGISIGSFSNPTEGNLLKFTEKTGVPLALKSEKWKTSYYGIGPSFKTNLGDFETIITGSRDRISLLNF